MNIVHCIYSFNTGGAETMLIDIVNEQVVSHRVTLIIVNDVYSQYLLDRIDSRVKLIKLGRKERSWNPWCFIHLNYILYTSRADVIHLHSSSLSKTILGPMKGRMMYTAHCLGIEVADLRNVVRVFAISEAVKDDLLSRSTREEIPSHKVMVIPNGINVPSIDAREKSQGDHFSIVNVARLCLEEKGQDILIRAIALLRDRGIENLSVDFIGEGPSRSFLEHLASELNLTDRINFLGLRDRAYIYSHLCHYDIMCHPARYEGFGLTVAEGMAAKLPILVATGDGPYEIIEHGKHGYSFENGDEVSCANALEYIFNHYEEAIGKTEEAWHHIRDNYSIQNTAQRYLEEYASR